MLCVLNKNIGDGVTEIKQYSTVLPLTPDSACEHELSTDNFQRLSLTPVQDFPEGFELKSL